jgi:hypothetical protein
MPQNSITQGSITRERPRAPDQQQLRYILRHVRRLDALAITNDDLHRNLLNEVCGIAPTEQLRISIAGYSVNLEPQMLQAHLVINCVSMKLCQVAGIFRGVTVIGSFDLDRMEEVPVISQYLYALETATLVMRWHDEAVPFDNIPYFTTTGPGAGVCVARIHDPPLCPEFRYGMDQAIDAAWFDVGKHLVECKLAAWRGEPLPPPPVWEGCTMMTVEQCKEKRGDEYELEGLV